MANEETDPLMEERAGIRNTTAQFLRSFSVLSDDSDFDELDEPDTPGDDLDCGPYTEVRHTTTSGVSVECGKYLDNADGRLIPFSSIHKPVKGFTHIRPNCWMKGTDIIARITDVQREDHPHMTRKAFNPNLYTIEVIHGEYRWTVKRRYKHFDSLHKALRLFRARYSLPVPTKQHRERRISIKEERKERKIKKKQDKKISRFPKKPEMLVREEALEKRRLHLEKYLQSILESKWYRNHCEVLKFLEVSELSFVNRLGLKWKEGDVNKCSGGRRISIGCCGCLKKYHVAGRWSKRWLVVKDTFIAYIRPSDGIVCDLMLMDSAFKVESGMTATGAPHGLLVRNQSRHLLAKCWTSRKADEWEESIQQAAETTGKEFIQENRHHSYAPIRENSYARWFVDGASYFEAVAEALEKAKEEIFISDWWLSPEIYLKRNVTDREKWRLDEVLARKANEGVKVFVVLYKELEIALTINSHYSKHALMNRSPNIKVIRHPDHVAGTNRVLLWAHHEKIVCIDQKTAFLGGLDLCYGRWDDEHHRMTDLGSIIFDPDKRSHHEGNGDVPEHRHGHKSSHRPTKSYKIPPSPILESPENHMTDSGIDEMAGNQHKEDEKVIGTQQLIEEGDDKKNKNFKNQSASNGKIVEMKGDSNAVDQDFNSNNRHSLCSEQEFGSNDLLTDNDSLENVDKAGFTNVVAEVDVHVQVHDADNTGVVVDNDDMCSKLCNNDDVDTSLSKHQPVSNVGTKTENIVKESEQNLAEVNSKLENVVDIDDIAFADSGEDDKKVDLEKIEKQIVKDSKDITNYGDRVQGNSVAQNTDNDITKSDDVTKEKTDDLNTCKENTANNGVQNMDLNKNETKSSVRFKQEIQEEHIIPSQAVPIEGTPKQKKDASSRRETWASRKLKRTFRLKDKTEDEDTVDGRDKSDSDDDSTGQGRFRNKWRMVLNIKKLEHAGKRSEDEDQEGESRSSSLAKHLSMSPHQSLSTIIRRPFRNQRQDSEDDLYFSLYPWKRRFFRRGEDQSQIQVKSVMKTSVADDYEGLEGSSKLWIGKDYVNFIHKDPVDVHNPFEDFIERDKTPRMPWHDIGAVVYGKAARDVARHFIQRWNFCKTEKFKTDKQFPILMPKSYAKCEVSPAIKEITYACNTQILRSISGWSSGVSTVEKSIHEAYIDSIKNAKHYIYIENQFFISQVGDQTPSNLVRNSIAEALVERIVRAYKENETFRVYVVLPLLPAFEGEIGANGGYAIQAVLHWNYRSISKGDNSVWAQLQSKVDDPKKYILFCGLRTHAELAGKLVTELVYIHSKLMIVDDDTVIIGSANINDRSLLGTRDSEIAVIVEDSEKFPVTMAGKEHMAGRFASSLRRTLFREHLGIKEYDFNIDLSDPVCDDFYKHIWLHQASINTTIYHKVFKCIPDDRLKTFQMVTDESLSKSLSETDPAAAKLELQKVKGRIVFMPLNFLEYEESIMASGANKESVMPMKLWL
ncbi:hypothetical protein ACF0H5_008141 [Mactra antiquata]